jgi:hypothetical protein
MKLDTALEILGIFVTVIVALWLTKQTSAVATTPAAGTTVETPQNVFLPGGITLPPAQTFNVSLPSSGTGNIKVKLPTSEGQNCCASCGCDPNSLDNSFAASVTDALNNYSTAIANLGQKYINSIFGNIPASISQYITIADPSSPAPS